MKIGTVKPTIYGDEQSSIHTFHVNCPLWVKFSICDLNIMLFNICEFHKNRCKKSHTFFMGINEIIFTHLP